MDLVSNVATAGKLDHKLQDDVTNRSTRLPEHVKAKNATKKTFKVVEGLVHTIWYNVSEHSTRRAEPLEARVDTAADGTFYISQVCEVDKPIVSHAAEPLMVLCESNVLQWQTPMYAFKLGNSFKAPPDTVEDGGERISGLFLVPVRPWLLVS